MRGASFPVRAATAIAYIYASLEASKVGKNVQFSSYKKPFSILILAVRPTLNQVQKMRERKRKGKNEEKGRQNGNKKVVFFKKIRALFFFSFAWSSHNENTLCPRVSYNVGGKYPPPPTFDSFFRPKDIGGPTDCL